jgi:hypothetical protein
LAGAQGVQMRQAQAQKDLGELQARTPGTIAELMREYRRREYEKGVARLGFQGDVMAQEAQTGRTMYQQQAQNQRTAAQQRGQTQRTVYQQQQQNKREAMKNALTAAKDAETARKNAAQERGEAAKARRPDAALSAKYGYIVDSRGKPILGKGGKRIRVVKTGKSGGGASGYGKPPPANK